MHDMREFTTAPAKLQQLKGACVFTEDIQRPMDSELPILTIAGAAGVGKKSIAARLLGHEAALPCTWHLDTKYYTADVQIRVVAIGHEESCSSSQRADSEALLLVFDVTEEESMHSLLRWMESLNGSLPEVCLMLANRMDMLAAGTSASEGWQEQAQDWCCQNLFEYIEVSAVNPDVDASLSRDGDRQGIRRIVSALQAHSWPGLCMKPRAGALNADFGMGQGRGDSTATALQPPQPRFHSSAAAALEHMPAHGPAPASAGQPASDQERMGPWQAASSENSSATEPAAHQQEHRAEAAVGTRHHNGDARAPESNGDVEESDSEEDGGLEEFDSMMHQLRQGREHLHGLPDEERRARAASMAAQMMQALGIHDEDSDDDSVA